MTTEKPTKNINNTNNNQHTLSKNRPKTHTRYQYSAQARKGQQGHRAGLGFFKTTMAVPRNDCILLGFFGPKITIFWESKKQKRRRKEGRRD